MIYANDQWIQLPTKDLYDTNIMLAAVSAAKDMYDKGQKRLDDFYEKLGDFSSPFKKDNETYAKLMEGINNSINNMYDNGQDPLRSAEGRANVQQLIRSFPVATMNQMKENAKMGNAYLDHIYQQP